MDQIADQLRAEIESLAEYIQRTEERLQVTDWVAQLLDPFEHLEDGLSHADLQRVISALHQARYHFEVNGHLSGRIESMLDRHSDLIDTGRLQAEDRTAVEPMPARDPAYADLSAEDEETQDTAPADSESDAFQAFNFGLDDQPVAADELFAPAVEPAGTGMRTATEPPRVPGLVTVPDAEDPAPEPVDDPSPLAADPNDLFGAPDDAGPGASTLEPESSPATARRPDPELPVPDSGSGSMDALFTDSRTPSPESPPSKRESSAVGTQITQDLAVERPEEGIDLFAHKVSIEDVLLRLDITVPAQDKTQLENLLRNKITSRVIAALRTDAAFEKQFILVPRLARFIHDGRLYPCTVKNVARTFIALFGDIKDLMKYRDERFLDTEVPEQGWALITSEAPRESLNKSYMEQTQYLRYLSAGLGISSHLVRRRTLIEAVYDCVVGRMVLGNTLQLRTLDWTSSGVGRNDYVCIYVSDAGIRLRDLPRTTHNHALGTVPSW